MARWCHNHADEFLIAARWPQQCENGPKIWSEHLKQWKRHYLHALGFTQWLWGGPCPIGRTHPCYHRHWRGMLMPLAWPWHHCDIWVGPWSHPFTNMEMPGSGLALECTSSVKHHHHFEAEQGWVWPVPGWETSWELTIPLRCIMKERQDINALLYINRFGTQTMSLLTVSAYKIVLAILPGMGFVWWCAITMSIGKVKKALQDWEWYSGEKIGWDPKVVMCKWKGNR